MIGRHRHDITASQNDLQVLWLKVAHPGWSHHFADCVFKPIRNRDRVQPSFNNDHDRFRDASCHYIQASSTAPMSSFIFTITVFRSG